jgi:putative ABC transport system permease protein
VVRTLSPPSSLRSAVRREIQAVDKNIPAFKIQTMKQIIDQSVAEPRFNMLLLGSFAGFAVLLAVMGIYGVMTYTAAQRNQEIGVRIALGAQHRDIVGLLLKEGMAPALTGLVIGLGGAFALTRVLLRLALRNRCKGPIHFRGCFSVAHVRSCRGLLCPCDSDFPDESYRSDPESMRQRPKFPFQGTVTRRVHE